MSTTNPLEITFHKAGNTIVGGPFSLYRRIDSAITAKSITVPEGITVQGDIGTMTRLAQYLELFGHCIKTDRAFRHACKLAGVEL